ncbi:MAG: methionine--tRNA ligase [Candidatus Omnitrophica bacterium]|nr:methionine--tRNA ligase [Candidatus Omnitrophota bacterium]
MPKTIYITTPLYYVNAAPHIGHSYTSVAADCLARYHRLRGEEVFLLTGTDEHGQKIAQAAAAAGKAPQAFADEVVERFRELWSLLGIRYDYFIRTTEPRHEQAVREVLTQLRGTLKQATYQGWYCTPDETFWTQEELGHQSGSSPTCPSCQRPLEPTNEEGWYLPLRANQRWLQAFVAEHPTFVQPETRYNELNSLLEQPLPEYLCITRPKSRVSWGIAAPFSPNHVVYVWFDALLNYITVPKFLGRAQELWPADVHFIGKDILRHHAVYWPIMLHEMGLSDAQMPRRIFAHGWWKIGEQKMSKSLGNIVDPTIVVTQLLKDQPYAADVYRYFLLREVPFGQDGLFSEEALVKRLTTDLGNDLGNLVNRTLSMIDRYCASRLPLAAGPGCAVDDESLRSLATAVPAALEQALSELNFSSALETIMRLVTEANQYIESQAPWSLAKAGHTARLHGVLHVLAEVLRIVAIVLQPFMPSVSAAIWQQLGLEGVPQRLSDAARWPGISDSRALAAHPVLFPRMEAIKTG